MPLAKVRAARVLSVDSDSEKRISLSTFYTGAYDSASNALARNIMWADCSIFILSCSLYPGRSARNDRTVAAAAAERW